MYAVCCAPGNVGYLIGQSVLSTITIVGRNLALKLSGGNKLTTSRSSHRDTYMKRIHPQHKLYTSDSDMLKSLNIFLDFVLVSWET